MSDIKKVRDYKKSRQPKPPISAAEHKFHCERITDSLMVIIEKMRKSPETIQPVAESFDELLDEMRSGVVKRQPIIINRESGESEKNLPAKLTKQNSGGAENSGEKIITQNFTAEEMRLLETLK